MIILCENTYELNRKGHYKKKKFTILLELFGMISIFEYDKGYTRKAIQKAKAVYKV